MSTGLSSVPTIVSTLPATTGSIAPALYQHNLLVALQYNNVFAGLTADSACSPGQAACVAGGEAVCRSDGAWNMTPCHAGARCYALPLNTTDNIELACVSSAAALDILGSLPGQVSAAPPPAADTPASIAATVAPSTAPAASQPPATTTPADAPQPGPMQSTTTIIASGTAQVTITVPPPPAQASTPLASSSPPAPPAPPAPAIPPASSVVQNSIQQITLSSSSSSVFVPSSIPLVVIPTTRGMLPAPIQETVVIDSSLSTSVGPDRTLIYSTMTVTSTLWATMWSTTTVR